jgi:hypothetical protein
VEEALSLYEAEHPQPPRVLEKVRKQAVKEFFQNLGTVTAEALGEEGRKKRARAGGEAKTSKMTDEERRAWNEKMLKIRLEKKAVKEGKASPTASANGGTAP